MNKAIKIALVEDEEMLGLIVKDSLESRGFLVDHFTNGESARSAIYTNSYDVLVLDVMLPIMDGFTLAKEIRKNDEDTPIIFLTARSQVSDVVEGFEIGGNDYLKKPFSMEELIVRINALAGRAIKKDLSLTKEEMIGSYKFHVQKQSLELKGEVKTLTHREAQILLMLFQKRNQILERKIVLDQLWGDDNFFNARSMDVFITRLRKYLRDDSSIQIVNVRGKGYKLIL